jgi:hypothetical protein
MSRRWWSASTAPPRCSRGPQHRSAGIPVPDLLGQDGEPVERLKQQIENAIRYEPAMTSDERAALERSATALREATSRVLGSGP